MNSVRLLLGKPELRSMSMGNSKPKISIAPVHKRNKLALFMMLPMMYFLWLVGWTVSWIGSNKEGDKQTRRPKQKNPSLAVLMPEQLVVPETPRE